MLTDSTTRYGLLSRLLHWIMAVLVIQQFFKFADRISEDNWLSSLFGPWHVSLGLTILGLVVLRLLWTLSQRRHRPGYPGLMGKLVNAGHALLYICLFLMPLTGICYMLGHGYGLRLFGSELVARSETEVPFLSLVGGLHEPLAWLFAALVIGHFGAALFHQFILRDGTLKRMA